MQRLRPINGTDENLYKEHVIDNTRQFHSKTSNILTMHDAAVIAASRNTGSNDVSNGYLIPRPPYRTIATP